MPRGSVSASAIYANEHLPALIGQAAQRAGVPRVVHLSSIKAAGEGTRHPLNSTGIPAPTTAYGISKLAGEESLRQGLGDEACLAVVRPPMVYGVGAPGNVSRLFHLASSGFPVPLPFPYATRSLLYRGNLIALLVHLAVSAVEVPPVVHWADTPHLTTRELVRRLARLANASGVVIPVPALPLYFLARAVGKESVVRSLGRDLIVEPTTTAGLCSWTPPFPDHSGLMQTVLGASE